MNRIYIAILVSMLLIFGCVEFGDGSAKTGQSNNVCPDGSVVSAPTECKAETPKLPDGTNKTTTLSDCKSTSVLTAITNNLLEANNNCRKTRITVLCDKCSSCCDATGEAKTQYAQSIDAACYPCANTYFGVALASDYYSKQGIYEKKCVENCPGLVNAYKALLEYAMANTCNPPAGWMICNDVTLD